MSTPSHEADRIVAQLKRVLKARGVTYRELAGRIGLSEPSVKRILSRGSLSLDRLATFCVAVGISVQELVRGSAGESVEEACQITPEQEEALAADSLLLGCFHLIASGRSVAQAARELDVAEARIGRVLVRLKELGLVELRGALRARALVGPAVAWRPDGPVRRLYESRAQGEFLNSAFAGADEALHLRTAELSEASRRVLLRKCEKLVAEFRDLAELDRSVDAEEKRNVGLFLAVRPWVFSLFAGVRRTNGGHGGRNH